MSRLSKYNHFQPYHNGHFIAFNALSGAVALMTEENLELYYSIAKKIKSGNDDEFSPEEKNLLEQLRYGKFVIASESDEIEALKFFHNVHRYDQTTLGLTIAPTMNCNMGCRYCFEDNKQGKMSSEVMDNIVKAVESKAPFLKSLDVSWYGGEPLLALDVIDELSTGFISLAGEHDFKYSSSMISNGYLLTSDVAKRLRELNVAIVQVTLDGPQNVHDRKRPLKNGNGSFEKTLENIKGASDYLGIGVRVNVDKSFSAEIISALLDELDSAGLKDRVMVYFGQLEPASEVCANIADNCYNSNEFSEMEVKYYRLLLEKGYMVGRAPSPLSIYCMAQGIGSHLIDPDGDLYRCYNHAGNKEKAVGNIADDINYQHPVFRDFFRFNPFEDTSCRECEVLPICMGGCPSRRVERKLSGEDLCDTWKHNLTSMLDIIALAKQQEQQKAAVAVKESK